MKVVWLTPYPIEKYRLHKKTNISSGFHTCSWIISLEELLTQNPQVQLSIITVSAEIEDSCSFKMNGIQYHYIKREELNIAGKNLRNFFNYLTFFKKERKEIVKIIDSIQPDIIHAFGTEDVYTLAANDSKFKSISHIQGIIHLYNQVKNLKIGTEWFLSKLHAMNETKSIKGTKNFFVRTRWDSGYIKKVNKRSNLFYAWESMRNEFFNPIVKDNSKKYLVFLGGPRSFKGYHHILEIFSAVSKEFSDLELIVGGNCNIKIEQEKLSASEYAHLSNRIKFTGILSANDIKTYFADSIALLCCSKMENSPNSICEAQLCKIPVISMNVGGIADLIDHNKNGFLFPYGDRQSFISTLRKLKNDSDLFKQISEEAQKTARERHNPETIRLKVMEAYDIIIKN